MKIEHRHCQNCGNKIERSRGAISNPDFCSQSCNMRFHKDINEMIQKYESEIKRLKKLKEEFSIKK